MAHILITGGTGLIGRHLIPLLRKRGNSLTVLTRGKSVERDGIRYLHWDINKRDLNTNEIKNVELIIHLAGENIGGGRWTQKRKRAIIESRVKSAEFLREGIETQSAPLRAFISSSAIGFYGAVTSNHIYSEEDLAGNDFLGTVCRLWEESVDSFQTFGARVVKLRTGVVLTSEGGVLKKMSLPVKWGLGAPLGTGRQYVPWVHIDDLIAVYLKAVSDEKMYGAYNVAAPEQVTNTQFMAIIAEVLKKPFYFPRIPELLLRIIVGEMAETVTKGSRVAVDKLQKAGFTFRYPLLFDAVRDLLAPSS